MLVEEVYEVLEAVEKNDFDGLSEELGDLLLHVPAQPAERRRVAGLLQRHHVHDVGYFAPGTFEQFPILDGD